MPEGPELHLASLFVNRVCNGVVFSGAVEKSEVSKSPDVPFTCDAYRVSAKSRGKEVRLTLTPIKTDSDDKPPKRAKAEQNQEPMDVVIRFGMSGFFRFTPENELPKHAHLRFYTREKPCQVLSFVDARRFGGWQANATWQPDRGPCIMFEYESFRENVLSNLKDKAFDRPICEVMLNQKYFSGIGNYLRAEILYRLNIPPFAKARTVLEGLRSQSEEDEKTAVKEELEVKSGKKSVRDSAPDLLSLCHTVPLEVVKMGGKGYDPEKSDYSAFKAWLQCYYVDGMKSIRDHNGRTMWFTGDPGPMAPKVTKSPKAKKRLKKEDHDYTDTKKGAKRKRTETSTKESKVAKPANSTKTPTAQKRPSRRQSVSKGPKSTQEEQVIHSKENGKPKGRRKSSTSVAQSQTGKAKRTKGSQRTPKDPSTPQLNNTGKRRRMSSSATEPQRRSSRTSRGV
ncbi:endonuclease 8-like 1 [Sardina pilchardus]|uniref:endonuclease 8-like 1 n=1 Tax=Sardina pilchardus TaxID=27697 RepID=UPI002E0FF765